MAMVAAMVAACSGSDDSSPVAAPSSASTAVPVTDGSSTTALVEEPEPSAGCRRAPDVAPISDERPGDVPQTLSSGGVERVYRLAVPADYDPDVAVPLVLNLHGSGSNAFQASGYGDVPRAATARGMVVVAAEAVDGQWQLAATGTDADFLTALLDDIEARYCIDRNHEHIVGMSLGAWKAAATACEVSDRFASVSLVTVEVFPGRCEPMAVIAFHGTADPVVPYGEGADAGVVVTGPNAGLPGARTNIANWAESAGCDAEPETSEIGTDVELWRYAGCDEGIGVELYTILGGGHTWPGSDIDVAALGVTTSTISATELTLDWFEAHPRS